MARAGWKAAALPFAALVGMLLSAELFAIALERLVWKVRLSADFALMQAAVERLHALPLAYHRDQSVGATVTKIERGIAGSMSAFSELVVRLLPSSLTYLSVSVFVMVRLEWRLALAVLVFAPLPALLGAGEEGRAPSSDNVRARSRRFHTPRSPRHQLVGCLERRVAREEPA